MIDCVKRQHFEQQASSTRLHFETRRSCAIGGKGPLLLRLIEQVVPLSLDTIKLLHPIVKEG